MPLVFLGSQPTEAARIDIGEFSDSGGTIINDGSGDVSSSNGSSHGATSLMSDLGLLNPTLAADLANLHILGTVTDADLQAVSADLSALRIIGTLASPCAAALNCAQMTSVRVGGSLSLNNGQDPVNVLFAFNVIGGALLNMPWGVTPGGLPTQSVQIGTPLDYRLSSAQIAFIVSRMQGLEVGDVRIGLGGLATGFTAGGAPENVGAVFEIPTVPEPGSLLLLAGGLIGRSARSRRRRTIVH